MILVTMVWGATFLTVQIAMTASGPLFFVGVRFCLAGLLSALIFHRVLRGLTGKEVFAGTAIGVMIFLGYALQTEGLRDVPSSKVAFITAFYVPLVPLLQWLVWRRAPRLMAWIGIALAFAGLVMISAPGARGLLFSWGEVVTILSAIAIAAEVILISYFAQGVDSRRVTLVQLWAAGLMSFALMPLAGESVPAFSWVWVLAALALGFASAVIQLVMNWGQKTVSPTRATIIYAGEPVWAGLVGRLAGERLGPLALIGGVLIVAGMVVSELRPRRRTPRTDRPERPL
ncbi:DMT family transporter [Pseudooceanicola aestuarii]|uniref:DMT family transporter n=1 Tax=Pseudooceanicola aestuarii TaxID=2697319 RepID=UPI0019546573|nr:DMT family transporter [Pseudooceanicola aestuarii]